MYNNIQPNRENPRLRAMIFSQLFFTWIVPLFYKGCKHGLTENDLPKCLPDDRSKELGDKLEGNWKKELAKAAKGSRKPKLFNALWHTFWSQFVVDGVICLIYVTLKSLIPLVLSQFLKQLPDMDSTNPLKGLDNFNGTLSNNSSLNYSLPVVVEKDDDALWFWSWLIWMWHDVASLGGLLVGSTLIGCFINHHMDQRMKRMGAKMRIACCSLMFRKSTKLSLKTAGDISVGHIVNLTSNDVNRLDMGFVFTHYLWILPLQTLLIGYLIWLRMGYAAIIGVVALLLQTIPVQVRLKSWTAKLRERIAERTDVRVSKMNELIRGIQVIKMYAWEKSFEKEVKEARRLEIQETRRAAYLRSFYLSSMILPERLTLFITIVTAVQMGVIMSADMIFSIANLYHVFQLVAGIFGPMGISLGAEAFASIKRIETFMLHAEKDEVPVCDSPRGRDNSLELENVTASWNSRKQASVNIEKVPYKGEELVELLPPTQPLKMTLENITFQVPKGALCAIVGPVGAGKSSIFQAILDELELQSGSLKMVGRISYASQEPWLFPVSIKNNIIFGQQEDIDRYAKVIECCELETDFRQLRFGDKTLVGEGGASLSGGQKARVNLARAVYNDASIYLFDDPLSAVDSRVGRQLFENVIGPKSTLLEGKTRILITHQIQYLHEADHIILVEEGKIKAAGDWETVRGQLSDQLRSSDNDNIVEEQLHTEEERNGSLVPNGVSEQSKNGHKKLLPETDKSDNQLEAEDQSKGTVKASIWWEYFHAGNSVSGLLWISLILIISQVICSGADYFVNIYTKIIFMDNLNQNTSISEDACLIIYSVLIIAVVVMIILRCYLFLKTCMHASKVLHERMFSCILKATMPFFDTNPSGRILNRFTKDMGAMDEKLPTHMSEFTHLALVMLGVLVVICIVNPIILTAVFVVGVVDYIIIKLYLRTSQDLKRLEGIRRSPVFSHVSSCLKGLPTIRSRNLQNVMIQEFDQLQDLHSAAYHLCLTSNTALGLWLDCANCCILLNSVTFSFILFNYGTYSGNVGLAITQAMMLTGMVQYGLRQLGEAFQQMTSVERILEYSKLKNVEKNDNKVNPKDWPEIGKIQFHNVSYKYKDKGNNVLKELNFAVEGEKKIGIVGRTGAGKTSLISALFRLYDIEGQIFIDNKDCANIDLDTLRSSISVIPQEPVLFKGTVRYNLDPFDQYKDKTEKLSDSLKTVGLDGFGLDDNVHESGSNFSTGQKQLLCLARALLRNKKILVLDEATANVDEATDIKIQNTIQTHFKACTVLTIAHRLKTVMDSDRILVLDKGRIKEFDVPHLLLQNPQGYLRQMVDATGDGSQVLYDRARLAFETKQENKQV